MTDPVGIAAAPPPTAPVIAPAAAAPAVELLTPLPVLPAVASFAATVVGRSPEGATLLRSAYGTLALKTGRPLPGGARVELRVQPGNPPSVSITSVATGAADDDAPPMQLNLGTTIAATVLAPGVDASDVSAGTRLLLRILAPFLAADPATLSGQVLAGAAGETLVETPIGTLALDRPLALPPGTEIALARLGAIPSAPNQAAPPSQASGWPALDQALAVLDKAAPGIAAQLRAALAPGTPAALAGTLLFLMGALYRGRWPGAAFEKALSAAGADALRVRLGADVAELSRLSTDSSTGSWRVLVLPLLADAGVQPLRIYWRRGGTQQDGTDGDARFVVDAELSRLGALQLDGLVRGKRLDLVLRSHAPLVQELRQEAEAIFHRVSDANGLHGDIVFATAAQFAVAPLAAQQPHVEVRA